MSKKNTVPTDQRVPVANRIPWIHALWSGMIALGLIATVACGSTTDPVDPTLPPPTDSAVAATDAPVAAATVGAAVGATRTPVATATRVVAPTSASGAPTPTVRIAPTPTRIIRATATPFVQATQALFATATPIPQVRANVIRPTATRFPTPSPTPFTGTSTGSSGSGVPTPTPGAQVGGETKASKIQSFTLETFTISAGTTVTWTNLDSAPHTATSGFAPNFDGAFDSPTMSKDDTFSYTFTSAGAFPYWCRIHPTSMSGVITVE